MTTTQTTHAPAELDGGTLGRLSLEWIGDRYQHRWQLSDEPITLLESIESDHAVAWPLSPPLQQVYRQDFADGRSVMFGVGMSGRGHWSASFTLVPDLRSWIVELACCSPTTPQRLSSTYNVAVKSNLQFNANDESLLACSLSDFQIRLEPLSQLTAFRFIESKLIISPANIQCGSTTSQWGYRLRIV